MSTKKTAEPEVKAEEAVVEPVPVTAAETAPAPAKAKAKKYELSNLAKYCRQLFGVSSCTFAGATAGMTGEYSVEEMKSIVEKWCRKGAK